MSVKVKEDTSGVEGYVPLGVDSKIIHINFKPSLSNHISEDVIHKCLECGWGIAEPEEHHSRFKEAKGGDEHSLPLIPFSNPNVVVSPTNIKLGKQGGIFHIVDEFRDKQ